MKDRLALSVFAALATISLMGPAMAVNIDELGGSWRLVETNGQPVATAENMPHFTIEEGRIHGYDGCNQFSGPFDAPQMMIVGQRACAGDYVKLPLDLSDPKAHLAEATLEGDRLRLPARGELPASTFERAPQ